MFIRNFIVSLSLTMFIAFGVCASEATPESENPQPANIEQQESTAAVDEAETTEVAKQPVGKELAREESSAQETPQFELFDAMDEGVVDVKFIGKSDRLGRLLIRNISDRDVDVRLPDAFVGRPVLAQFGGGGGRGGGGFGGGGLGGGAGGGNQSVGGGGGFGGGGGGGGFGGGGGGFFSIPPEKMAKFNLPVVCLDHGKKDPSSSVPYEIVRAEEHLDRPAVIALLKAFGAGELDHGATQAAVWHLNNDLGWQQLATKLTGTVRSWNRQPYFSRYQIQAGMAYAAEAIRRVQNSVDAQDTSLSTAHDTDRYDYEQTQPN